MHTLQLPRVRQAGYSRTPVGGVNPGNSSAALLSLLNIFFSFDNVVFGDVGSVLTIDFPVTHGYRPVIDFGYLYGLLPISLAHLWFRAIGRTPLALVGLAFFYNLIFVWGLANLAVRLRMDTAGRLLRICSVGFMTWSATCHGLEAVLLCKNPKLRSEFKNELMDFL